MERLANVMFALSILVFAGAVVAEVAASLEMGFWWTVTSGWMICVFLGSCAVSLASAVVSMLRNLM